MEKRTSYAEFSSQLNERNTVVIELGRQYTRCGFAGEPSPRAIIRTTYQDAENSHVCLHDITDQEELLSKLANFVDRIYFNYLAVSPKEKKVVIVESIFCKSQFRNTLIKILFDQFNVPSLLFVPDHLMALVTLGRSTGLIVDIGAREASSIAVIDGITLLDGSQFASLGATAIDSMIADELKRSFPNLRKVLTPDVIEDIRIKSCFVAPFVRGLKMTSDKFKKSKEMQSEAIRLAEAQNLEISIGSMNNCYFLPEPDHESPAQVNYSIGGQHTITLAGNLREGACEMFFEIVGHEHSLTTMIVETILMAPIDCRRTLAENILVIGGLANMAGLEHRLCEELKNIDKYERFGRKIPDRFGFHRPICPKNYVSWLGASMFCTTSSMELRATTREQWIRAGKKNLTEWSDLA